MRINLSMRALVRPLPECRVLVIGGGAIGMLSALLLRAYGVAGAAGGRDQSAAPRLAASGTPAARRLRSAPSTRRRENAFDFVIDAVGSAVTRTAALAAVAPGGVVMHIGLQDWASEIDMRKLTLAEITLIGTYTYSMADLRATVAALARGAFGDLAWVEERTAGRWRRARSTICTRAARPRPRSCSNRPTDADLDACA